MLACLLGVLRSMKSGLSQVLLSLFFSSRSAVSRLETRDSERGEDEEAAYVYMYTGHIYHTHIMSVSEPAAWLITKPELFLLFCRTDLLGCSARCGSWCYITNF